ncbi:MAG: hypothetical protein JWP57_4607 [Spirosoma sp.]|nr:hypothetical protein [Spirosoma sp.]
MTIALGEAMDRYWAKFQSHPPMTMALHSNDYPALIQAMDQAIARGRRMTEAEVFRIGGVEAPESYNGRLPAGVWPPVL